MSSMCLRPKFSGGRQQPPTFGLSQCESAGSRSLHLIRQRMEEVSSNLTSCSQKTAPEFGSQQEGRHKAKKQYNRSQRYSQTRVTVVRCTYHSCKGQYPNHERNNPNANSQKAELKHLWRSDVGWKGGRSQRGQAKNQR